MYREREERDIARSIDSVLAARPSFEPYATVPKLAKSSTAPSATIMMTTKHA